MNWVANIRFLASARDFSLRCSVQTGSGAHLIFYSMDIGALSHRVRWLGHEANHSPACSSEVKNGEASPPLTHTS
jgi:hypothetical protein